MFLFYFTWQVPPAQPTEPVLVLQINPDHVVAGTVLPKQSSPVSQHATTVVVEHPDNTVYDAVHEVAVSAHE